MKRSIVYKLTIDLENNSILASSQNSDMKHEVDEFNNDILSKLYSIGLNRDNAFPVAISEVNGGYAVYNKLFLDCKIMKITLLIDVRCGDHPSKPNLVTKSNRRHQFDDDKHSNINYIDIDVEDTYCIRTDEGQVVYYVGKGEEYGQPICDKERALDTVVSRIKKFISTRVESYSDEMLSKYGREAVSLVSEYLSEISDLHVSNDDGIEVSDIDSSEYIDELHEYYMDKAFECDAVSSDDEFNKICEILKLKNTYCDEV